VVVIWGGLKVFGQVSRFYLGHSQEILNILSRILSSIPVD
jgi:hypothetical protein